jgi:predicted dehydrogenase
VVRIGIAGVGFMGMMHFLAAGRLTDAKVAAIATRDPRKRAGDWTMIQGNFGPRGSHVDLAGVETFESVDAMVRSPDVDLVDVCLPSDQHAEAAVRALEAGKHVLVEKPIALDLADADRMLAAAESAGRMLMVAHVLPFFADFRFAWEAVRSGRYGTLLAASFRRHISPPDWSDSVADLARMGGPLIDLHIHDAHFIVLLCGRPKQVYARGVERNGVVEYVSTEYVYDAGGPIVGATSGCLSQPSRPFTHGYELYFERATVHYEAGALALYAPSGRETPPLDPGDEIESFRAELAEAVRAVATREPSTLLDARLARDALALCILEGQSVRTGRILDA